VGPEAGPLSLAVDEGSSTTITTTNPQPEKSRLAKESFVSDRVLDESAGQVCLVVLCLCCLCCQPFPLGIFLLVAPALSGARDAARCQKSRYIRPTFGFRVALVGVCIWYSSMQQYFLIAIVSLMYPCQREVNLTSTVQ